MKIKKILIVLGLVIASIVVICLIGFGVKKVYENILAANLKNIDWIRKNVNLEVSDISQDIDIYVVTKNKNITTYNMLYQQVVSDYIEDLSKKNDILMVYNPYSTNTNAVNIYFNSDKTLKVNYTIETDGYSDFSRTLKNNESDDTYYSYQLIGFIAGEENHLTLKFTDENNNVTEKKYTIDLSNYEAKAENKLKVTTESKEEVTDGLFAILGDSADEDYIHLYDNDGYLRSEIPIIGYRALRLLFKDDKMYTSISEKKIAEINSLGEVTKIYKLGDYKLHHDYQFDTDKENLVVLATDTTNESCEDVVIKLNLKTGKITDSFYLEEVFPDLRESAYYNIDEVPDEVESVGVDWMHINTIEYFDGDTVILSAREVSSILKISNIFDDPKIEYIIGDKKFWENYDEYDYLLTKVGDFTTAGGQHTVSYIPTEDDDVYYLEMFNNNLGISMTVPDFDWAKIGLKFSTPKDDGVSYYYKYKVDENKGIYELVSSYEVPFSAYMSSVQSFKGNTIIDSASTCEFSERTSDGKIIRSYNIECNSSVYRVFKYTFDNYYFES